jgi:hypothetical protein
MKTRKCGKTSDMMIMLNVCRAENHFMATENQSVIMNSISATKRRCIDQPKAQIFSVFICDKLTVASIIYMLVKKKHGIHHLI